MHWRILLTLWVIYMIYATLGGVIFHFLESQQEQTTKTDTRVFRERFLNNFTCINPTNFDNLVKSILAAYENGVLMTNQSTPDNWDMASSVFFSITVVTTIGYGHISPTTTGGKIFCVCYALVGIPLVAVMLGALGQKLWERMEEFGRSHCCGEKKKLWKTTRNCAFIASGVLFLMVIPAAIFVAVEGWDWWSAFYYTFITLSTIGFGDYVAGLNAQDPEATGPWRAFYRICVAIWIILGLAWLSTIISMGQDLFTARVEKANEDLEAKIKERLGKESKDDSGDAFDEMKNRNETYMISAPESPAKTKNTSVISPM